jgi:predicted cytidylate kinase
MKFRAITISGEVASGKSSVANSLLAQLPNWTRVNTGQRFRDFCASKGMTIQQVAELTDETHREFDQSQKLLLSTEKHIVVEGRLAGWLARDIEDVFRVFCFAPLETRIDRYVRRDKTSREQARIDIEHRDAKDIEKFLKIYGVQDYRDPAFYHLELDTSTLLPDDLAQIIIDQAKLQGEL